MAAPMSSEPCARWPRLPRNPGMEPAGATGDWTERYEAGEQNSKCSSGWGRACSCTCGLEFGAICSRRTIANLYRHCRIPLAYASLHRPPDDPRYCSACRKDSLHHCSQANWPGRRPVNSWPGLDVASSPPGSLCENRASGPGPFAAASSRFISSSFAFRARARGRRD